MPFLRISLVAQTAKHLPAMWETRVLFLGREDPLEKEMAVHSSTLTWKIPWTKEPDRLQSMGSQRVGHIYKVSRETITQFLQWLEDAYFVFAIPTYSASVAKQAREFRKIY